MDKIIVINVEKKDGVFGELTACYLTDEVTGVVTAFFASNPFIVAEGSDLNEAEKNLFAELAMITRKDFPSEKPGVIMKTYDIKP